MAYESEWQKDSLQLKEIDAFLENRITWFALQSSTKYKIYNRDKTNDGSMKSKKNRIHSIALTRDQTVRSVALGPEFASFPRFGI